MEIKSIIKEVYDGRHQERDIKSVIGSAVHRVGVDSKTGTVLGFDGVSICNEFTGRGNLGDRVSKYTNSQLAYTFLIGGNLGPSEFDGVIWQCLPLDEIGHHARRFSRGYIGVGLIADPRVEPPSLEQRRSLVWLLSKLTASLSLNPYKSIKGHGEIKGAHGGSKAPGEPDACPGDKLNMNVLRDDVSIAMRASPRLALTQSGLDWEWEHPAQKLQNKKR